MSENKDLLPHQLRIVTEHKEVSTRLNALHHFLYNEPFPNAIYTNLDIEDKIDLHLQHHHMTEYVKILSKRISKF